MQLVGTFAMEVANREEIGLRLCLRKGCCREENKSLSAHITTNTSRIKKKNGKITI